MERRVLRMNRLSALGTIPAMPQAILNPIIPALVDEAYRIAATIWVVPWCRDTYQGVVQLIALINDW